MYAPIGRRGHDRHSGFLQEVPGQTQLWATHTDPSSLCRDCRGYILCRRGHEREGARPEARGKVAQDLTLQASRGAAVDGPSPVWCWYVDDERICQGPAFDLHTESASEMSFQVQCSESQVRLPMVAYAVQSLKSVRHEREVLTWKT